MNVFVSYTETALSMLRSATYLDSILSTAVYASICEPVYVDVHQVHSMLCRWAPYVPAVVRKSSEIMKQGYTAAYIAGILMQMAMYLSMFSVHP